jgi:hypothetical protein
LFRKTFVSYYYIDYDDEDENEDIYKVRLTSQDELVRVGRKVVVRNDREVKKFWCRCKDVSVFFGHWSPSVPSCPLQRQTNDALVPDGWKVDLGVVDGTEEESMCFLAKYFDNRVPRSDLLVLAGRSLVL